MLHFMFFLGMALCLAGLVLTWRKTNDYWYEVTRPFMKGLFIIFIILGIIVILQMWYNNLFQAYD
jgi:cytochrome bd-type quinol oxidase subunit 1